MMKWNIRELKARGAELASENRAPARQLVLLYCGVLALLTLGSNGLNLYLNSQIGTTGGLDGLGLRSVLLTVQEILIYVNMFFGPFWSAGFLFAMIGTVRGRTPQTRDLTEGFRRFFRILGHMLFEAMVVLMLMMPSVYLGATIFAMSPLSAGFEEAMVPVLEDPNLLTAEGLMNPDAIPVELILEYGIPMVLVAMAVFCLFYALISYQFRLSLYLVMDRNMGAFRARFVSMHLMRGHKWQMFRLDLSWWWYYALMGLIGVVGYLDAILGMLGIPVPVDPTVMFFATLAASCVLNIALGLWKKCPVDASYALAFDAIACPEAAETAE